MAYRTWTSAIALAVGATFIAGAAAADGSKPWRWDGNDVRPWNPNGDQWSDNWWDKNVDEDVDIDVRVREVIDPDGWVEVQVDQFNSGDVTANLIYDGTFGGGGGQDGAATVNFNIDVDASAYASASAYARAYARAYAEAYAATWRTKGYGSYDEAYAAAYANAFARARATATANADTDVSYEIEVPTGLTDASKLPEVELSNSAFGNAVIGETETATTVDIRQTNRGDIEANTAAFQWDPDSYVAWDFDEGTDGGFDGAAVWGGGIETALDINTVAAGNLVNISMLEPTTDEAFFMADIEQTNSGNVTATTVASQDLSGYGNFQNFQMLDSEGYADAAAGVVATITNLAAGNLVSFDVGQYVDVGQNTVEFGGGAQ